MFKKRLPHFESYRSGRANWLRARVLRYSGAVVSTSSLTLDVAGAAGSEENLLVTRACRPSASTSTQRELPGARQEPRTL